MLHSPPLPPPRLAAAALLLLLLLLLLAFASAQLDHSAVADDAQLGTLAEDRLHEGALNESPNFSQRRRPSRWRSRSPEVVGPTDSSTTPSQPSVDVVDSQEFGSSSPPGRPYRSRTLTTQQISRNRTSTYAPVFRRPQHRYALRGNHEQSSSTASRVTFPLTFSSTTATTEDSERTSNFKATLTSATAEPTVGRDNPGEKSPFSEDFNNRLTESPLSIDLPVTDRPPALTEIGREDVSKSTHRWTLSSSATASGFDSRRTSPRAAGIRSLFGRRSKHRSTLQPEQYTSPSTSQFSTTAATPLIRTVQLDGHARAARDYEVLETTTPQVVARTPRGRRRLVSVSRRVRPIDASTEATVSPRGDERQDQRSVVRVQKRRRPVTIDTTTVSTVSTTKVRDSLRKTKVYKRRRPVPANAVTTEPSLLEGDASGNQRGYRRVRPSSPQQESTNQQGSTTNSESYKPSAQSSSKSEETFVGGRRKNVGKVRVRGRRPLLSDSETGVGSSEKAVEGEGFGTVLTATVETPQSTTSVVQEVPKPHAPPSMSTTIEATTSRRVLSRSRRPFFGIRRAVAPSIAPSVQAEPVSSTTPSSLQEENNTADSLTSYTPTERGDTITEGTTVEWINMSTISPTNQSTTQITGDTVSEDEGGQSEQFTAKFGGAKGRHPGRRVGLGSKYSKEQRKTTPEPNRIGLTSERTKASKVSTTSERPTGNISDRFVKSRTLNSLRNRKPISLLRRNNVSNITEALTAANKSLDEHTVETESPVATDGGSASFLNMSVVDNNITTDSPAPTTIKGKDRLKKIKRPLAVTKTGGPPKLPVLKKISSNFTEDEKAETSTISEKGTRLKGRKPTSLDKLLKMRRPLPTLLRKSQNEFVSPAPENVEGSSNSETRSAISTLPTSADTTPGQTTADEIETTTAAAATSSLQTNIDDGVPNGTRKLPKGFKPPRFRPTLGEPRKIGIKDTPRQGVRVRPRLTPSSAVKKGVNGTQATAPLKTGLFGNRRPFSGLKPSLLKSTGRLNKKPTDSADENTEIPTTSVKGTTEAYNASLKVADKVIKDFGVNTASTVDDEEVQNVTTDRPTVTTEETATFQAKNDSLGNEAGETLDSLVDTSLSPLEESSTTTRKTFFFPRAGGRGSDKSSKLKSLQKLLSVLRQKSNGGVASTTVKSDTETVHPTPEVPSELTSDSAGGRPSDLQSTVSQTEIPILGANTVSYGDDLKTTDTTEESTFTTVIETTVVPVVREGKASRLGITENYGNTFLQPSMTTEATAFSVTEKSGTEDNTTVVTKIFEAETETTFPETTTESGGRLVLEGSDSLDGENSGMKCMSGESMTTNEHLSSVQTGEKMKDNASGLCGKDVRTGTTELPLSGTKRPDDVPPTLESSTEVLHQSTTTVYAETATVTEPSLTFQMATLLPELIVPEVRKEPTSTETTEGTAPGSKSQRFPLTDIVLHNLTKAISQLANEIDSVYTHINVASEFTLAPTTDLPNITEQATHASVELNTPISPGIENAVLTTETPIATDTVTAETLPQQFSTTSETTTTEVNTEDPGTSIGTTVENTYSAVVKVTELPTATTAVLEEVTVPAADAVNAETVPQQYHTTSETTTHASTEDPATAIGATVQNIYSAVVKETELPTATTAVPVETKVLSGMDLEQSTTSIQGRNLFTKSVHTDKALATTEVSDMWIGVTSGNVTEVYETTATQTESPDSEATEGNLSDNSLPTTSPITEENGRNITKFVNGALTDFSDDQSEFDSSFSRGKTSIVPAVDEFRTADTTVAPDLSTTALVLEVQGDDRGYSTIDDVVTYDNGVSTVMPEYDAFNDVNNSYTVKVDQGALLGFASGEEQENLTIESSANNGTTEATVYQTRQPVTNEAVTELVTESETLEPSTLKNSDVNDTAVSDSNSILGYEMATDPDTVTAEVTEEGLSSTTVQTIKPEENDLKANEVKFDDSLYLPTTQVKYASPTQRLEPTNTDSSVSTTTEPNPYVSGSRINPAEEMATYSSLLDTASTANAFAEDENTVSPGDITSPAVSDNTVTASTPTEPGSHLPEKTTSLTHFGDEITTESTSVADDSELLENYASSGPFYIQAVTSFNSLLGERAHFHKETTSSPFSDPLITSMDNEDDRNEGPSAWHSSFAESESTTADHDTSFSPTVTDAFPMTSETVAGVTDVTSVQFSNTKQDSREDDDVVKYRDIEHNSIYTDVSTPTFVDSVQSTTPLSASNYTEQWTERIENNGTVNQDDIVTGITEASFIYTDTTKSPSPDSEDNNHQLLTTGAATQSQTENGLATYWTESVESAATDTLLSREVEPLTSDTKDISESSFSDNSTNYASPDDESLHGNGNGRFPALDINTLAPS
ncbi:mucin-4-like [Schistocerca gregaria]|uniref:mucin-4-like n=1 Tax=Schistocerca gregaria TaxID=7010 RepID=UPI00211EF6B0|nr:mucin-4-like [Schistocerca gregaria]